MIWIFVCCDLMVFPAYCTNKQLGSHTSSNILPASLGFLMELSCSFWSLSISKGALSMKASSPYYTWTANKGSEVESNASGAAPKDEGCKIIGTMGFFSCAQNGTENDSQPNQTMAPAGDKLYFKHSFRNSDGLLLSYVGQSCFETNYWSRLASSPHNWYIIDSLNI